MNKNKYKNGGLLSLAKNAEMNSSYACVCDSCEIVFVNDVRTLTKTACPRGQF